MKKIGILALLAALLLCLCTGCADMPLVEAAPEAELVYPALPETDYPRMYGLPTEDICGDDVLQSHVRLPSGDVPALDRALSDWVTETSRELEDALARSALTGTFTADYGSYEVNGRVVSAFVVGTLRTSEGELTREFGCFHADRETGELLSLEDLLQEGASEPLMNLLGFEGEGDALPERFLATDSGVTFWPARGGPVSLTYLELLGILALPGEEALPTLDPTRPMVALTFDDGPSGNTDTILDLLEQYGARATFYVVGSRVADYAPQIRRAAEMGNEIGIHTWDHSTLTGLSREEIARQITDTQAVIEQYAGVTPRTVRPTGGAYNDTVKEVSGELGFILVNWSVDPEDWKTRDAERTYQAIMDHVRDGSIILCHDLYASTAEAMERVIPELLDQGYQLVTVSELLSCSQRDITPGEVYFNR